MDDKGATPDREDAGTVDSVLRAVAHAPHRSAPPATIGRYRVLDRLGAGGMGEVYKAQDPTLERLVALKILSPEVVADEERVRRFVQEAKAASALNHPSIVTVYEIGESPSPAEAARPLRYIAMEYIDGRSLGAEIQDTKTPLRRLLELLTQAAEGLTKAHATGIVHRDLKPDNIMVSRDGFAKVVDFGLAKLIADTPTSGDDATRSMDASPPRTRAGVVLGTVGYMSPEQVRGEAADFRSDVFSFGCILFEAVTRCRPFDGRTPVDVLHAILHADPPPLRELNADAPPELERIVRKCLNKDPRARYPSMQDLVVDLREVLRHLEPATARRRTDRAWAAIVSVALVAAFAAWRLFGASDPAPEPRATPASRAIQGVQSVRLTSGGKSLAAAISPDGKNVAYVVSEAGRQSLWIRQVGTATNVEVVRPGEVHYHELAFSPDGSFVYYSTGRAPGFGLHRLSILGGAPILIARPSNAAFAVSPDGKRLAIASGAGLALVSADGTGESSLAARSFPGFISRIAWAPDGNRIVYAVRDLEARLTKLVEAPIDGRAPRTLRTPRWRDTSGLAWLPGGAALLVSAGEPHSRTHGLWRLTVPGGEAQRLVNDPNAYEGVSLTADARTLATCGSTIIRACGSSLARNLQPRRRSHRPRLAIAASRGHRMGGFFTRRARAERVTCGSRTRTAQGAPSSAPAGTRRILRPRRTAATSCSLRMLPQGKHFGGSTETEVIRCRSRKPRRWTLPRSPRTVAGRSTRRFPRRAYPPSGRSRLRAGKPPGSCRCSGAEPRFRRTDVSSRRSSLDPTPVSSSRRSKVRHAGRVTS